jgi:sigma-B regulation protein RsbU (phosphoserine phosphatase)
VSVAVFIFELLRIVGSPASLPKWLIFSLIIGNWVAVFISLTMRSFLRRSFPLNWLIFIPSLLIAGATGSVAAHIASFLLLQHPSTHLADGLTGSIGLGTLITAMFGAVSFLVGQQKSNLDQKNLELQRRVLIGEVEGKAHLAEMDQAREIQSYLLPRKTPQIKGFDIACAYQPATAVGGDYFDVFELDNGRMAVCIGDVSGKGIGAALVMSNVQASLH